MKDKKIIQRWDRQSKLVTAIVLIAFIGVAVWFFFRSSGSFLPAWFLLQSTVFLLLVWIGMPRKVVVSQNRLLMVSVLRLISIEMDNIKAIRQIDTFAIPVISTVGLMGHFGLYYFRKEKCFAEAFAGTWKNLLLIECKSGKKYVIGVDNVEDFMTSVNQYGFNPLA